MATQSITEHNARVKLATEIVRAETFADRNLLDVDGDFFRHLHREMRASERARKPLVEDFRAVRINVDTARMMGGKVSLRRIERSGGTDKYIRCGNPNCSRRGRYLYPSPQGNLCRECAGLTYASRRLSHKQRAELAREKAAGQEGKISRK